MNIRQLIKQLQDIEKMCPDTDVKIAIYDIDNGGGRHIESDFTIDGPVTEIDTFLEVGIR